MNNQIENKPVRPDERLPERSERTTGPLIGGVTAGSFGLIEETIEVTFDVLRAARVEAKSAATGAIDLAENVQRGVFRLGRGLTDGIDRVVARGLDGSEQSIRDLLGTMRSGVDGLNEAAQNVSKGVIGPAPRTKSPESSN